MLKKLKNYFELNKKYKFDTTDITALIYLACAVLGIMGKNVSLLFLIGSTISTIFCWQARRFNVIILNVALFIFNLYTIF